MFLRREERAKLRWRRGESSLIMAPASLGANLTKLQPKLFASVCGKKKVYVHRCYLSLTKQEKIKKFNENFHRNFNGISSLARMDTDGVPPRRRRKPQGLSLAVCDDEEREREQVALRFVLNIHSV